MGTVVIEDPGAGAYAELLAELGDAAQVYEGLNEPTQRRIYVQLVVAVKDRGGAGQSPVHCGITGQPL